ncbi:MAG: class I SAM-dependent methyltransferase, partial [Pseudomonadota bacterium]|nr:class I SAM-dependent methyltransferase [Pseudomonadota bacterium]
MEYEFTNNWFGNIGEKIWTQLLPQITPEKMLEIGCFEGRATTHLIEKSVWSDQCELFCIDTWGGGIENKIRGVNMSKVEERFDHNVALARERRSGAPEVRKLKGLSHQLLPRLLAEGHENSFDFIY